MSFAEDRTQPETVVTIPDETSFLLPSRSESQYPSVHRHILFQLATADPAVTACTLLLDMTVGVVYLVLAEGVGRFTQSNSAGDGPLSAVSTTMFAGSLLDLLLLGACRSVVVEFLCYVHPMSLYGKEYWEVTPFFSPNDGSHGQNGAATTNHHNGEARSGYGAVGTDAEPIDVDSPEESGPPVVRSVTPRKDVPARTTPELCIGDDYSTPCDVGGHLTTALEGSFRLVRSFQTAYQLDDDNSVYGTPSGGTFYNSFNGTDRSSLVSSDVYGTPQGNFVGIGTSLTSRESIRSSARPRQNHRRAPSTASRSSMLSPVLRAPRGGGGGMASSSYSGANPTERFQTPPSHRDHLVIPPLLSELGRTPSQASTLDLSNGRAGSVRSDEDGEMGIFFRDMDSSGRKQSPNRDFGDDGAADEAMRLLLENNFSGAEELLCQKSKHRTSPRHALYLGELYVIKRLISGRIEDGDKALTLLKTAESIALRSLDEKGADSLASSIQTDLSSLSTSPPVPETSSDSLEPSQLRLHKSVLRRWNAECCLAEALLLRGILQGMVGREIKSSFNIRKSLKHYRRLFTQISSSKAQLYEPVEFESADTVMSRYRRNVDDSILMGWAVFHLDVRKTLPSFASTLRTVGVEIDVPLVLRDLRKVVDRDGERAPFAAVILLISAAASPLGLVGPNAEDLSRLEEAVEVEEKYSQNVLHALASSLLHLRLGRPDMSLTRLETCLQVFTLNHNTRLFPVALHFEMGLVLALKCDWIGAREAFEQAARGNDRGGVNEWGEVAGAFSVGCCVVVGEDGWEDVAQRVLDRRGGNGEKRKDRLAKMCLSILDQSLRRAVPPYMLLFTLLYLRGDLTHLAAQSQTASHATNLTTMLHSIEQAFSRLASDPTVDDNATYLLITGTLEKYHSISSVEGRARDECGEKARRKLESCLEMEGEVSVDAGWVPAFARFELAELEGAVFGRWDVCVEKLRGCLERVESSGRNGVVSSGTESGSSSTVLASGPTGAGMMARSIGSGTGSGIGVPSFVMRDGMDAAGEAVSSSSLHSVSSLVRGTGSSASSPTGPSQARFVMRDALRVRCRVALRQAEARRASNSPGLG
ncbi:hypothetical protein HK104_001101 [Borealophlyctis nickersoniae]|nr:hypothetical protein HK104_001101 [Borealophlyctis nickersoniae]